MQRRMRAVLGMRNTFYDQSKLYRIVKVQARTNALQPDLAGPTSLEFQ